MKQLTIEHFQKPLPGENEGLDNPADRQFRSVPATINGPPSLPQLVEEPMAPPIPMALRPFVSTPEYQSPSIRSHAELVLTLSQHIPLNDYKLPSHIYRPDLLDPKMFNDIQEGDYQKVLSFLEAAEVKIDYHEGYPSIQGLPLWCALPWESPDDYNVFENYLNLPGARQLHLLPRDYGRRAAALFHTNYWAFRVQASDALAVVHHQRMRQQRILKTDDRHFLEAEKLLTQLTKLAPSVNWDNLKEEPDKFVKTLAQVIELQRKALGADRKEAEPQKAAQSVEVTMRTMIQQPGDPNSPAPNGPTITEDGELDIRDILRKAGDVKQLQELVLRVGR